MPTGDYFYRYNGVDPLQPIGQLPQHISCPCVSPQTETKPCGCVVGFCRAETLLDALTRAIMSLNPATPTAQLDALEDAYRAKAAECCGGFRITNGLPILCCPAR